MVTDSELAILDVAVLFREARDRYRHPGIEGTFNVRSHRLDERELAVTFDDMEQKGILRSKRGEGDDKWSWSVEVTQKGASLWESVRSPDWNRYVTRFIAASASVQISGYSAQCCWRYLGAMVQCGAIPLDALSLRADFKKGRLVYWRPETEYYNLSIEPNKGSEFGELSEEQWDLLNCQRICWSSISELLRADAETK